MPEFIARVGTFFYLMGIGFVILFIASDVTAATVAGSRTDYGLLFIGVLLFSFGFLFRRHAPPPPAADRFRVFRKYRENQKKKNEDKAKAQQQKK